MTQPYRPGSPAVYLMPERTLKSVTTQGWAVRVWPVWVSSISRSFMGYNVTLRPTRVAEGQEVNPEVNPEHAEFLKALDRLNDHIDGLQIAVDEHGVGANLLPFDESVRADIERRGGGYLCMPDYRRIREQGEEGLAQGWSS